MAPSIKTVFATAALSLALSNLTGVSAQIQSQSAEVFRSDFNSSLKLTLLQIESSQLDHLTVESLQNLINAERSQMAYGGPSEDDFYTLPPLTNSVTPLKAGQIIKVQPVTDTSAFALPPNTALSRIIYTTTNLNGTVIPASGFILWPYLPKTFPSSSPTSAKFRRDNKTPQPPKAKVIVWTHGTSGVYTSNAPSAQRFLWYGHTAPFALAQAGYAVFAPDYAGLGVRTTNKPPHEYLVAPSGAYDALYGLRAALAAFPDNLDRDWIIMGHSQGGGVAWSAAEMLASPSGTSRPNPFADLIPGYKGSIPISPVTQFLRAPHWVLSAAGQMLHTIFPDFELGYWMTPLGINRTRLAGEIEGELPIYGALGFADPVNETRLIRGDFLEASYHARALAKLADPGGRAFRGPMLVIQGGEDILVEETATNQTVAATAQVLGKGGKAQGQEDLEYLVAKGAGHTPAIDATRVLWMQWIEDRFAGKEIVNGKGKGKGGLVRTVVESFLEYGRYNRFGYSIPLWVGLPEYAYLSPLPI